MEFLSTKPTVLGDLRRLQSTMPMVRFNKFLLILSFASASVAAVFEGLSLTLLIPTIKILMESDQPLLRNIPFIGLPLRRLIDELGQDSPYVVFFLIVATFISTLAKTCLSYIGSLASAWNVKRFSYQMRRFLFGRYLSYSKLFFDHHSHEHLSEVLTGHVSAVSGALSAVQSSFYALITLCIYFSMMLSISWKLTVVVIAIFPVLNFSLNWLIRRIESASEALTESFNELERRVSNALSSIPLVKAYSFEPEEERRFDHLSENICQLGYGLEKNNLLVTPLQEILLLCFIFSLVSVIAWIISFDPTAQMAGFVVFIITLRRASGLLGTFNEIRSNLASIAGPLRDILRTLTPDPRFVVSNGGTEFLTLRHEISFRNLKFHYPQGVSALNGVTFSIQKGKTTAIIGYTGSGKSTVINLLMRFYECEPGSLLVDGLDIRELNTDSWRRAIAMVGQDTFMFNDTLFANLTYGLRREVPKDELEEVLKKARLSGIVAALPHGLDTQIGVRGVRLSGGEKQRVSIARAMLKNSQILVLDEATSALDSVTEKEIQEALKELVKDRTVIVVAHRLSTIRDADWVVVLEGGKVVEQGGPTQLLEAKGAFYRYWETSRI